MGTGPISGWVDLEDRTKYHVVHGDDSVEHQREVTYTCDAPCSPTGTTAVLKKSRILYYRRPLIVYCQSADYQTALTNSEAVIDVINDARASQLSVACMSGSSSPPPFQYVVRQIGNQSSPSVWTILDGDATESRLELSGLWIITLKIELLLMPGAEFLDGNGFPAMGVNVAGVPI